MDNVFRHFLKTIHFYGNTT